MNKTCAFPDCADKVRSRDLCKRHYGQQLARTARAAGPYRPIPYNRDELLDEWVFLRGWVRFEDFGPRVGIAQVSWERAFERARSAGDPRAVRALNDPARWPDPARGLRAVLSGTRSRREAA